MKTSEMKANTKRHLWLALTFVLFFVVILTVVAFHSAAASVVDWGYCGAQGDNVKWVLDSNGTLTFSGSGEMKNFEFYEDQPWVSYDSNLNKVVVENGVTSIGDYAFCDFDALYSLTLSNSITSIGTDAFSFCNKLSRVLLPSSVTSIGDDAFDRCSSLSKIKVEKGCKYFASDEFGCLYNQEKTVLIQYPIGNKRTSFRIPDGVKTIKRNSFDNADLLKSVVVPYSVTRIEAHAFNSCNKLVTVQIYNPNCKIKDFGFRNSSLILYGYEDSSTQSFADEYFYKFSELQHTHVFSSKIYTNKATFKENGKQYLVCSECGTPKKYKTIPKISSVKLEKTQYAYTGKAITPKVIVKDSQGNTLQKNTDYKVKYSSGRTELGAYNVKVTFCGNYSGKKTLTFKISLGKVKNVRITERTEDNRAIIGWTQVAGAQEYQVQVYVEGVGYVALDNRIQQGKKLSILAQNETIRIRACAEMNGKMHYGPYSEAFVVKA